MVKFFCLFHSSNKLEAGASGFFKPKCSSSASMADISIKGDAYLQYADKGIGQSGSTTVNAKRVNLNVIGKFGVTKVVASFRTS
jgi:hypothetical protein